ncbi:PD-(D/E)XK nuclease family transposase [Bacillota bacterium HCP3S3_F3_2]
MVKRSSHSRTMEFVQKLRPIDNAFFPVLGQDPGVMEEILRVILNDNTLTVEKVIAEYTLPNLPGRGVRLDSFCETGDGHRINVEVQKADDDDHIRRCRYNAAGMTWKEAEKGTRFKDLPDVCVVYITEHDFLHGGRTVYHVDKILRENGSLIDDGSSVIYVNTAVNDGSAISDLMRCFLQKTVNDPRFPRLSEKVHQYKNTEKGAAEMCEELERYIDEITAELQASNSEKDRALFENSKIISEKNKVITEKDKEIARLNELVASLSKGDSRPANS